MQAISPGSPGYKRLLNMYKRGHVLYQSGVVYIPSKEQGRIVFRPEFTDDLPAPEISELHDVTGHLLPELRDHMAYTLD